MDPNTPPQPAQPKTPPLPPLDPARVDAFKKNLGYLYGESLELFGLPVDVLLGQVFQNASQQSLSAMGKMVNFGQGSMFMPNSEVLQGWIESFFDRVLPPKPGADMPEA